MKLGRTLEAGTNRGKGLVDKGLTGFGSALILPVERRQEPVRRPIPQGDKENAASYGERKNSST